MTGLPQMDGMISMIEEIGCTWKEFISEAAMMDLKGAWNDPYRGVFSWQTYIPEGMREGVWEELPVQARCALYWASIKLANAASDAYGDSHDRDIY